MVTIYCTPEEASFLLRILEAYPSGSLAMSLRQTIARALARTRVPVPLFNTP